MAIDFSRYDTPAPAAPRKRSSSAIDFSRYDAPETQLPSRLESFGRGAADGASLGLGDEGMGAIAGIRAAMGGEDFGQAYAEQVAESRGRLAVSRRLHPIVTGAGGFAGGAAGFAVPFLGAPARAAASLKWTGGIGRALNTAAQGRGASAVAAQAALGAGGGATIGTAYGFASGNDTLESRLESAGEGAMFGGLFGLASPALNAAGSAAVNTLVRPVERAARGAMSQVKRAQSPVIERGSLRNVSDDLPPPVIPNSVVRDLDRMASDAGMGIDDLEFAFNAARADPRGRVLADLIPGQGVDKVSYLAAAPGSTGARALEVAQARAQGQPVRLRDATKSALGADKTRLEAKLGLQEDYKDASEKLYEPLWKNAGWTQQQEGLFQGRIAPLGDATVNGKALFRDAEKRAQELFNNDLLIGTFRGRNVGTWEQNRARQLHYQKMAIDAQIKKWEGSVTSGGGIDAKALQDAYQLRNIFIDALDPPPVPKEGAFFAGEAPIIPGYRPAREQWAGLKESEDALKLGARWLRGGDEAMRPQEVKMEFDALLPSEKHYARIGLANVLDRRFAKRSAVEGAENNQIKNAAGAISDDEVAQIVSQVFDSPDQARAYLSILNEERSLLGNAAAWVQGPRTAQRMLHDKDKSMDVIQEAALNPAIATAQAGRRLLTEARQAIQRRQNDELGDALLAPVDSPFDDSAKVKALFEEMRKLAERRAAMAAQAGRTAGAETLGLGGMIGPDQAQFF